MCVQVLHVLTPEFYTEPFHQSKTNIITVISFPSSATKALNFREAKASNVSSLANGQITSRFANVSTNNT